LPAAARRGPAAAGASGAAARAVLAGVPGGEAARVPVAGDAAGAGAVPQGGLVGPADVPLAGRSHRRVGAGGTVGGGRGERPAGGAGPGRHDGDVHRAAGAAGRRAAADAALAGRAVLRADGRRLAGGAGGGRGGEGAGPVRGAAVVAARVAGGRAGRPGGLAP